ncbi:hypothetical protein AURDEDRAFT_117644 [Auricularia subglabra TFB-10046 SS5]|uniref:Uncharacterized protein n=1 Tax=Auricularia subglabra (strain TFB-10046 / SS5) TaxID=717982 RepID=J0LCU0_AURST|nr:hypothetical protein AURDEDRAFT_117644 [Auricularia subglabra TFB-10046 SS5]
MHYNRSKNAAEMLVGRVWRGQARGSRSQNGAAQQKFLDTLWAASLIVQIRP